MSESPMQSYRLRRISELIAGRFEGILDETEFEELSGYLIEDPAALAEYVEQASLWADLRNLARKREKTSIRKSGERKTSFFSSARLLAFSAGLAACIAAIFFYSVMEPSRTGKTNAAQEGKETAFATLLSASEAVWEDSGDLTITSRLPARKLRLLKGFAAIRLDGGARLALQGPTVFEITDRNTLNLLEGKALVSLRKYGNVIVHAPGFTLRDFGTEFGILAAGGKQGETRFDVFEGEVEVSPEGIKAKKLTMKAGQGGRTIKGAEVEPVWVDVLPYVELTNFAPEICVSSSKLAKNKIGTKSVSGITEGILVEKGKTNLLGLWMDVRPNEGKDVGEILVPEKLSDTFSHVFTSNRVRVEWTKNEDQSHPIATKISNLRPKTDEGSLVGNIVAKWDDNWIEIKPVEGPLRRFVPRWIGGQDGGLDATAKSLIREVEVGSEVKVQWIYDERLRLVNLSPVD